jgi:hypothetical protein
MPRPSFVTDSETVFDVCIDADQVTKSSHGDRMMDAYKIGACY